MIGLSIAGKLKGNARWEQCWLDVSGLLYFLFSMRFVSMGLRKGMRCVLQWLRGGISHAQGCVPRAMSHKKQASVDGERRPLRRDVLPLLMLPVGLLVGDNAQASKLGPAVDGLWEGVGGGPADLFFPDAFEGTWDVTSSLVNVETPLGPEFVPDMKVCAPN